MKYLLQDIFKYQVPEKSEVIEERLKELELNISESLESLFGMEGAYNV